MDAWELVGIYQNQLAYHAGVVYNNRAMSIAGVSGANEVPWILETMDGRNIKALDLTPSGLTARGLHAACVFDERIWVSGGYADQAGLTDILVSQDGKNYEKMMDMPNGLFTHRLVAFGNPRVNIVSLGGYSNGEYINNIFKSTNGKTYEEVNPIGDMWTGRGGFGCLEYKNKLWVFGGIGEVLGMDMCFNDVWWTDDLIHWHRALEHAPWAVRSDFGYCVWDERMWVIAGADYVGRLKVPKDDVWFSRDGSTWEKAFDFPTHLRNTYVGVIDNMMHVFGGVGNENSVYKLRLG
jgi:N-acetylneuraminic acid mutarotase